MSWAITNEILNFVLKDENLVGGLAPPLDYRNIKKLMDSLNKKMSWAITNEILNFVFDENPVPVLELGLDSGLPRGATGYQL